MESNGAVVGEDSGVPVKLEPMLDWVVIRESAPETLPGGTIILPEKARDFVTEATVLAVGPGHYDGGVFIATRLKPGDVVHLDPHMKTLKNDKFGEPLKLVRERDVVLKVLEVQGQG